MTMIAERIPVICADSHVSEPPDLWLSRMPSKFGDLVPRVVHDDTLDTDTWLIGGRYTWPSWFTSVAGFGGVLPDHPRRQEDVDPASYDRTPEPGAWTNTAW